MVVGALTRCALLHSVCDLKAIQMNVQRSQNRELILYDFDLDDNATEATKNIGCTKGEGTIDDSRVTKWFKKFRSGCKNLDDQAMSGRTKTVAFEAVLSSQRKSVSGTERVSGELGISQSSVVRQLHHLGKSIRSC